MDYNLEPMWNAILEVWRECYAICRRHNLRIWVGYGTAIGAVRHKGFIPWDDDFDVMMPRKDYNLFMKYAAEELPPYMKWHSIDNDPSHLLMFGKVQDERIEVLELVKTKSNLNINQGIYIDFFPLDGLPKCKIGCFLWYVIRSVIRRGRLFGDDMHKMQRWIAKRSFDECSNVAWLLSDIRYPKCVFKKEWFADTKLVDFADSKVPVPSGIHEILSNLYGDYMQFPPEDQRVPKHQS